MPENLKPWHAIATPHEDICEGRLAEAVFAANLWAVVRGKAPEVYLDPEEFFAKTYMTEGLAALLRRVASGLSGGEAGDRVLSLQTVFGGGKTHGLVALWHLAHNAEVLRSSEEAAELREALQDSFPDEIQGVAVFTNETCDATQGRKTPEGVHTHTLWGEIALQLGGPELYERVRANDESQRVPQGIFADLLEKVSPCLILVDELADYLVGAASVKVGGTETTLADQTISFVQQLTEAAQQVDGAVVVATLPASKYEVASSEAGQEAFTTLERRFQRLGADLKPVGDDEIYDVVIRRLFESTAPEDYPDAPKAVAKACQALYASHEGEVPPEASQRAYRERLERAYPFHPSLIDALYTRWGAHPDFQRTRGVLRLLASIVADLWNRRDAASQSQPLIQPCHIRWSLDPLQAAVTRLWGPAYQSVIGADILGERANAPALDEERGGDYRREGIARGVASAIFLGSFGGQGERSGFSSKDLRLACNRPGLNWGYTEGALLELENRCFYLHTAGAGSLGKRYWFGTKPNLNKLVVQYRQQMEQESFEEEIREALQEAARQASSGETSWRVLVDPGEDLPEQKSLTLLLLPPHLVWSDGEESQEQVRKAVLQRSRRCGAKDRQYRNTLLFLVPTTRGVSRLRSALRERNALRSIRHDYGGQIDAEQMEDLDDRIRAADRTAAEALPAAYTVALRARGDDLEVCPLADARAGLKDHLAFLWNTLVEDEEWILRRVGSVTLGKAGLVPEERGIALREAVEAFLRYTDKPMIAAKAAVTAGLTQACADGVVGIGRGPSLEKLQSRICGQQVSMLPEEEGVWILPPFEPEEPTAESEATTPADAETRRRPSSGSLFDQASPGEQPPRSDPAGEGIRRIRIRGAVPPESWSELFRCFVKPAVDKQPKDLRLGIDFEIATSRDRALDPDDPSLKAMEESARQLGLEMDTDGEGEA